MSSTSEIYFKGRKFYAFKSTLKVWMLTVMHEIDKVTNQSAWLQEMRYSWEAYTVGGADLDYFYSLDYNITDYERLTLMLSLCEAALQHLDTYGPVMSKELLNSTMIPPGAGWYFLDDIPTVEFKKVGIYFIKLLKGELDPEENDTRVFDDD